MLQTRKSWQMFVKIGVLVMVCQGTMVRSVVHLCKSENVYGH